jgi:hypothetical protein
MPLMQSDAPEAEQVLDSQTKKRLPQSTPESRAKAKEAQAANRIALKTVSASSMESFRKARAACWGEARVKQVAGLMDRAAEGSLAAAAGLKCFDCTAGDKAEVARCQIRDCPLWPHRPWRGGVADGPQPRGDGDQ